LTYSTISHVYGSRIYQIEELRQLGDRGTNTSEKDIDHAAWWREAGFDLVFVVWQYLCIALMAGRRP